MKLIIFIQAVYNKPKGNSSGIMTSSLHERYLSAEDLLQN
jgi:hypothetical protein